MDGTSEEAEITNVFPNSNWSTPNENTNPSNSTFLFIAVNMINFLFRTNLLNIIVLG